MKPNSFHHELTDALRDDIGLHALRLLDEVDAEQMSRHLEDGCVLCNQEYAALAGVTAELVAAVPLHVPSPGVRERLLERVAGDNANKQADDGIYVIRDGEGKWKRTPWEGVTYSLLFRDKQTGMTTSLVRVDPGGRYPAHRHHGVEQSWVVEGSCRIGTTTIRAGDYACAAAGSTHSVLESDDGCLLLIMSSAKDEILA